IASKPKRRAPCGGGPGCSPGPRRRRSEGLSLHIQIRILPANRWEIGAIRDSADAEVDGDRLARGDAQVGGDQGAGDPVSDGVALEHLESDRPASGIGLDADVVLRALLPGTVALGHLLMAEVDESLRPVAAQDEAVVEGAVVAAERCDGVEERRLPLVEKE